MGTGLDATLVDNATCGASDSLSTALGTSWSSGTALSCDGDGDYAEALDDPLFESSNFTISTWVFSDDYGACYGLCTIVSKAQSEEFTEGYFLYVLASNGQLEMNVGGGEGGEMTVVGDVLTTSVWHHIVATLDESVVTLYIDGEISASETNSTGISYGDPSFLIGAMTNRSYDFSGLIDEVALWNYAKNADEVTELYESYVGVPDGGVDAG